MPEPWQVWIKSGRRFRVAYTSYDWSLNEQEHGSMKVHP
jgi:hypothetical protein